MRSILMTDKDFLKDVLKEFTFNNINVSLDTLKYKNEGIKIGSVWYSSLHDGYRYVESRLPELWNKKALYDFTPNTIENIRQASACLKRLNIEYFLYSWEYKV